MIDVAYAAEMAQDAIRRSSRWGLAAGFVDEDVQLFFADFAEDLVSLPKNHLLLLAGIEVDLEREPVEPEQWDAVWCGNLHQMADAIEQAHGIFGRRAIRTGLAAAVIALDP